MVFVFFFHSSNIKNYILILNTTSIQISDQLIACGWSQLQSPCTVIKACVKPATPGDGLSWSDLVASLLQFVILLAQMQMTKKGRIRPTMLTKGSYLPSVFLADHTVSLSFHLRVIKIKVFTWILFSLSCFQVLLYIMFTKDGL